MAGDFASLVSGIGSDSAPAEAGCLPPIPDLSALLAGRKRSAPRCQSNPAGVMSPMDEAMWFDTPTIANFVFADSLFHVVAPANPQRVGLIFSVYAIIQLTQSITPGSITGTVLPDGSGGWIVNLVTSVDTVETSLSGVVIVPPANVIGSNPNVAGVNGYVLTDGNWSMAFLQSDYGSLVSGEWQAYSPTGSNELLTVTEIVLRDWPRCP